MKFLAKIASDMNKPDGLTFITREQMPQMILTLPIRKVPGVGKQAMARMTELNIQTLGDIQRFGLSLLTRKFGKFGHRLFELSRGIDNDPVRTETTRKSISNEDYPGKGHFRCRCGPKDSVVSGRPGGTGIETETADK